MTWRGAVRAPAGIPRLAPCRAGPPAPARLDLSRAPLRGAGSTSIDFFRTGRYVPLLPVGFAAAGCLEPIGMARRAGWRGGRRAPDRVALTAGWWSVPRLPSGTVSDTSLEEADRKVTGVRRRLRCGPRDAHHADSTSTVPASSLDHNVWPRSESRRNSGRYAAMLLSEPEIHQSH